MPPAVKPASQDRIRPLVALRALRALLRDPDDTARVFEIVSALSGRQPAKLHARFASTPRGARLLRERPSLLASLSDRDALLALPPGTLGRVYAEFMSREDLSADGLVAASEQGRDAILSEERRWLGDRLRDMHDLWHVVTGYDRDLTGEASLLAFSLAQTGNKGVALVVAAAYLRGGPDARRMIRQAYRRGRRAEWLPTHDWEAALAEPLDDLRRQLRLGEPPVYARVPSPGAPALAT